MFVFVRRACSLSRNNNLHSLSDTAPFFINLQRTVIIFDDEPVAANIYKVKYYNGETRDVLTWTFTSTSTKYAFDTSTGTLEHTKHTHRHMYIYCVWCELIDDFVVVFFCSNIITDARWKSRNCHQPKTNIITYHIHMVKVYRLNISLLWESYSIFKQRNCLDTNQQAITTMQSWRKHIMY